MSIKTVYEYRYATRTPFRLPRPVEIARDRFDRLLFAGMLAVQFEIVPEGRFSL